MKYLIVRVGEALGDILVVSPLLRHLKQQGHEVVVLTGKCGHVLLHGNPNVDRLIYHRKGSVPDEDLKTYFKVIERNYGCDRAVNLCGSVEGRIIFVSHQPQYNYPKYERRVLAEKNMYELTFELADIELPVFEDEEDAADFFRPEMFFTKEEKDRASSFAVKHLGRKIVIWGLSGSSTHKTYPYTARVMSNLLRLYNDLVFVTVGDEDCQILEEELRHPRVIRMSGRMKFRDTCALIKHAALVVCPETGLLHAAGCFDVPKMGLLSHTSIETLTKWFRNDYSQEPRVPCAPCFRFIQSPKYECPLDEVTGGPVCQSEGHNPDLLTLQIENILWKKNPVLFAR